jgi:hypothetical protein
LVKVIDFSKDSGMNLLHSMVRNTIGISSKICLLYLFGILI